MSTDTKNKVQDALNQVDTMRRHIGEEFRDEIVADIYNHARHVADQVVTRGQAAGWQLEEKLDRLITHPIWGLPLMLVLLAIVFWITVSGANIPSAFLAGLLMEEGGLTGWFNEYIGTHAPAMLQVSGYELLHQFAGLIHLPEWVSGLLIDGIYLCLAWVISVMLPPMAIFFPMFTLLEDLGYLPRVAFNLDWMFSRAGAHGKQALTMAMGFGCNAAGVTACRIIDSPREKLLAIMTNNFMICNGRFPTVIAIATIMVAASAPAGLTSLVAAMTVVGLVLLGVLFTFLVSWAMSGTILQGEASAFTLELPPYRRPSILRVIYTSIIDRTIFVLARACIVAVPAGAVIWIVANVSISGQSLAEHLTQWLDPLGWVMGLDGVIILAYIIAIPANEIVMPTILMLYMKNNIMIEQEGAALGAVLQANDWTLLTAACLLLFCLLHNPCGTTIWTIWRETRSVKWTIMGAIMPLLLGIAVCALIAGIVRITA